MGFCEAASPVGPHPTAAARRNPTARLVSPRSILAFRLQLKLIQKFLVCKAKSNESGVADDSIFTSVPTTFLTAEREEAKAVLSLFLRKQGLSNIMAVRATNRSECFIDNLISKLHSIHKSRYLVGRELTTLEIRNALAPYLESLLQEHGDVFVSMVENFPDPPGISDRAPPPASLVTISDVGSKKERAIARVSERNPEGLLPAHILYLLDLGMDIDQIKSIARRFLAFAYYSLDRKVKPVVDLFLELGVPQSNIPKILYKRPQLCGISLSDNLKPMMAYLEEMGVDKSRWAKVIHRFPALLTYSRQKVQLVVDYLYELGVSRENIGKILTRCPHIVSYSIDEKLRPTVEYFLSLGIDVASLIHRCPQTFGLSIEANLKPITEFFVEKGYSVDEIATMVLRYGALYTFSLADNLLPKWEFFLTMGYPRSELVKFPHYFGYSLEVRIKPRLARMRECEVRIVLNQVLSTSAAEFEKVLERKVVKLSKLGLLR